MCNIAGYNGTKNAAPILIEMIKKQENFDGGLSTGIATVHEGKLYYAKILGNADDLASKTDALNLPGTIGIIHSRPDDDFFVNAHPFIAENEKTALVENGVVFRTEKLVKLRDEITDTLLKDGVDFYSAKITDRIGGNQILPDGRCVSYDDIYARYIEYLRKQGITDYVKAMTKASTEMFSDSVYLLLSAFSPDNIYVSRMTRPMNIMKTNEGCYLSTSQLAFPDAENIEYIKSLPQMKTSAVTKDGFTVSDEDIGNANVVDYTEEEYKNFTKEIRKKLENKPWPMDGLGGGIFVRNTSPDLVKPNVKAVYDALWELKKEGVLKMEDKDHELSWLPGRILKRTFFYI